MVSCHPMRPTPSTVSSALAAALVRDYLSRRGLKRALAELNAASPLVADDITSRTELVEELQLQPLLTENRRRESPSATLLELLVEARRSVEADHTAVMAEPLAQPPAAASRVVSLPSGGPLATSSDSAAARGARPPRPKSAKSGARTPNVVGGVAVVGRKPTCSELARRPTSAAAGEAAAPRAVHLQERVAAELVVRPGELNGGSCKLTELQSCKVLVLDWSTQVIVEDCHDCHVLLGPVDGSVMVRGCTGLQIHAVCRQMRCLRCVESVLRIYTLGPVIESCTRLRFAPWDAAYPGLPDHFASAALDATLPNRWDRVHDFTAPPEGEPTANWRVLLAAEADAEAPAWFVEDIPGDDDAHPHLQQHKPPTTTARNPVPPPPLWRAGAEQRDSTSFGAPAVPLAVALSLSAQPGGCRARLRVAPQTVPLT